MSRLLLYINSGKCCHLIGCRSRRALGDSRLKSCRMHIPLPNLRRQVWRKRGESFDAGLPVLVLPVAASECTLTPPPSGRGPRRRRLQEGLVPVLCHIGRAKWAKGFHDTESNGGRHSGRAGTCNLRYWSEDRTRQGKREKKISVSAVASCRIDRAETLKGRVRGRGPPSGFSAVVCRPALILGPGRDFACPQCDARLRLCASQPCRTRRRAHGTEAETGGVANTWYRTGGGGGHARETECGGGGGGCGYCVTCSVFLFFFFYLCIVLFFLFFWSCL